MSKKITNSWQKETIYTRDNGKCVMCGKKLTAKTMTIAHKLPLSRGGTNEIDNLVLSCWHCSHAKQNLTMEEFLKKLWEILQYNEEEILEISQKWYQN